MRARIFGARGLLISITGGPDLTLYEVDEAATRIREEVDSDANIILGATFDDTLEGTRWGLGMELPVSRSVYLRLDYIATAYDEAVEFTSPGGTPDQLSLLNRDRTFRIGVGVRF